jgi:hypothetical protein
MGDDDPRLRWRRLHSLQASSTFGFRSLIMEIIGTCINCWPAFASLTANVCFAIAALSIAIYRTA